MSANEVHECMGALERWLHDEPERTSPLLKAAQSHVQFEFIHPFLDGNGRVGRLLVTLILCVEGVLQQPLLYLSLYLKRRRDEYYALEKIGVARKLTGRERHRVFAYDQYLRILSEGTEPMSLARAR